MAVKKASSKAAAVPENSEPVAEVAGEVKYSVLVHTDELGFEVFEPIAAGSGDEAARIALEKKSDEGASVRGVNPYAEKEA